MSTILTDGASKRFATISDFNIRYTVIMLWKYKNQA